MLTSSHFCSDRWTSKLFSGVSDGGKNLNRTVLQAVKQRSYIDGAEGGIWAQESGFKPPLNIFLYYIYWNTKYMSNYSYNGKTFFKINTSDGPLYVI